MEMVDGGMAGNGPRRPGLGLSLAVCRVGVGWWAWLLLGVVGVVVFWARR